MTRRGFIVPLLFAMAFPSTASAGTLGPSSSGTMTISVTIPPLGPALDASREGAEGLWSIVAGGNGMMLKAPEVFSPGEAPRITLFASEVSSLRVLSFGGIPVALPTGAIGANRDLQNRTFQLPSSDVAVIPLENAAVFTIGTV